MNEKECKLCECGCGKYAKPGNRFIHGHNLRGKDNSGKNNPFYGKTHTNESKAKNSKAHTGKVTGRKISDETRRRMSKAQLGRKGGAWKDHPLFEINPEDDLVKHHYIYDLDNPLKYTVKMTRSNHTKLHRLLQKLGYVVPRINNDTEGI